MKVTITEGCDRCKRETPKDVDSSEIAAIEAAREQLSAKTSDVTQSLETQAKDPGMPDLVIFFKGKVYTIGRVCDDHCAKTVQNNIDTICKVIEKRKGKPKKSKSDGDKTKKEKTAGSEVKDKKPSASSSKS